MGRPRLADTAEGYPSGVTLGPLNHTGGAALYIHLLMTQREWIYRRVETVTLVEERRYRRQMSIDFRIPPEIIETVNEWGLRNFPIPLHFLRKGPLTALDIRDDSGRSVPVLSRSQNGKLACLGVEEVCVTGLQMLRTEALTKIISDVVMEPKDNIDVLLAQLKDDRFDVLELKDLARYVGWSVESLNKDFVLAIDLAADSLSRRQIVKVAYDIDPLRPKSFSGVGRPTLLATRVANFLGVASETFSLPVPGIQGCGSYHFELRSPAGLDLTKLRFVPDKAPSGESLLAFSGAQVSTSIGHYTVQLKEEQTVSNGSNQDFVMLASLAPAAGGMVFAAALCGTLAALILVWGHHNAATLLAQTSDPAAALLLLVPGLVLSFLIRPGEHALTSRILRGTRLLMVIPGLASFAAAADLAVQPPTSSMQGFWFWLIVVAAVSSVFTWFITVQGWRRARRRDNEMQGLPGRVAPAR